MTASGEASPPPRTRRRPPGFWGARPATRAQRAAYAILGTLSLGVVVGLFWFGTTAGTGFGMLDAGLAGACVSGGILLLAAAILGRTVRL